MTTKLVIFTENRDALYKKRCKTVFFFFGGF